jgi:tripartite-type tricarboxylate transporter receptor subunit TctC
MFTRRQFVQSASSAAAFAPLMTTGARADAYPEREIHSIGMFPAGSGADVMVRYFSNRLSEMAGKPVIVDNKAGAFGNIASSFVARAKPDGYTIYIAPGSSVLAAAPSLFNQLNYDPVNDFEHITTLFKVTFIQIVASNSPYKTVADLTKALKEKGDKGSYGSVANTGLVSSELYKKALGLNTVEVKYKEVQSMLVDLMNGRIEFCHIDPTSVLGQLQDGSVRAISTSSTQRIRALPDVPSASEAGIANLDLVAWWSVHTPKGTPKPILDQLEGWFNKLARDEEAAKWLATIGCDPYPGDGKLVRELLEKDIKAWDGYVKLANIPKLG